MTMLLLAWAAALAVQSPLIRWFGDPPVTGGIAWLEVVPATAVDSVTGLLDGAPLAFTRFGETWAAPAATPITNRTSALARITIYREGRAVVRTRRLPVGRRGFRRTRLRVASQFVTRPDSALAARIAAERAQVAPLADVALATPLLISAAFQQPSTGPVAANFGDARVFNGAVRSRHWGTDFDGATGDTVRAANHGVVMLTGEFFYSGGSVYLNHGAGLISSYFHMSRIFVAVGDTVETGQVIGLMGSSGRVTGPHLHWQVKVGDRPVDGTTILGLPLPVAHDTL